MAGKIEKNNSNSDGNHPIDREAVSVQVRNSLTMKFAANALMDNIQVYGPGDHQFLQHAFQQLEWIREVNWQVADFVAGYNAANPHHPRKLSISAATRQVHSEVSRFESELNQVALDTIGGSKSYSVNWSLETSLSTLCTALQQLYNGLKQIDEHEEKNSALHPAD